MQVIMTKEEFECRMKITSEWSKFKALRYNLELGESDDFEYYTAILSIAYKYHQITNEEYDEYYHQLTEAINIEYTYEEIDGIIKGFNNIFDN